MRVIAAGTSVVLVVAGVFFLRPPAVDIVDHKFCDLLTAWVDPGKQSGRIVVVEIDEKSLNRYGRWPWPRNLLGSLVRRVHDAGAATIVLDTMFPEQDPGELTKDRAGVHPPSRPADDRSSSETNDNALAAALTGKPAVIGYSLRFGGDDAGSSRCLLQSLPLVVAGPFEAGERAFFRASGVVCSVPEIAQAASGSGFLNAAPDRDGKLRRLPLVIEHGDRFYPALALAALTVYRSVTTMQLTTDVRGAARLRLDGLTVPMEGPACLRLRFRGPGRTFPYVSAAEVLEGRLPADRIQGKIAIVGVSAPGVQDTTATPVDPLFPGLEIHATVLDNLLQGDALSHPGDAHLWELTSLLIVGFASTFLLAVVRSLWGALIALALGAGTWMGCALVLSSTGVLLSPFPATTALVCSYSVLTLIDYLLEKKRAERTASQLASARKVMQHALQESESRYQRLVEYVNDAIIMDDFEGRLVFANRRFRTWFGLHNRDIHEVILEDYVAPEWRPVLRDQHDRRVRGEPVPDHFEFEGIQAGGTRIWIEALVTNVEENGRITGTQSALRDITERKRIEAQYLQAQKMESIGRLAGGVAHDFNNLLTVINGYSEMLLSQLERENDFRGPVEEIRRAGERAAELTQKLLAFSRKQVAQLKPVDVNLVVADSEKMFGRLVGEDIELIVRLAPQLGEVMADPGQIHQVLMNLVVNARDAMPHGGKLVIETRAIEVDDGFISRHPEMARGAYVYLGVADTGVGMDENVRKSVFEPFFTTKDPGKGTGLGLAAVYGIVRQSGGWIWVSSEPGQGAAFHVYLPRIGARLPAQRGASQPPPALQGSETVLLVEDQDAVRQVAKTALESYGYRVLQASSGSNAIALAGQFPEIIHLLLTDIVLPGMNGRELADALKAARPGMKVIYTSGYPAELTSPDGSVASSLAWLPKPFSPDALAAKVRQALAG